MATVIQSRRPTGAVSTAATGVACRTDRRPLAGGVYDPVTDRTVVTWAGAHADSYAQTYDHGTGTWSAPVFIGPGGGDPHNYPTVVLADDGHYLVFRGMHNVELLMSRSAAPHSVAGWHTSSVPGATAATYPMPVRLGNGDIIVFFRETTKTIDPAAPDDTRPTRFVRSGDHGLTWSDCGRPYVIGSTGRADNMNEIYHGQLRHSPARAGRDERIELVWTLAGGGPEGNLHDRYHRNLYVASFDPATGHFFAPSGTDLGPVVDDDAQERSCRVVQTPIDPPPEVLMLGRIRILSPDYIQLVGVLDDGRPVVLWSTTEAGQLLTHAAVWSAGGWRTRRIAVDLWLKELEPLGGDRFRVFATRADRPRLEVYTLDGSLAFTPAGGVDTPGAVQRVELLTGWPGGGRVLATGAASARDVAIADGDVHLIDIPDAGAEV